MGELRSAQEAMDGALAIRRSLHTRDAGKHLFSKELQQVQLALQPYVSHPATLCVPPCNPKPTCRDS